MGSIQGKSTLYGMHDKGEKNILYKIWDIDGYKVTHHAGKGKAIFVHVAC